MYESKCSNAVLEDLLNADIPDDTDDYDHFGLRIVEQLAKAGGNVAGEGKDNPFGEVMQVQGENVVTEMWLQPEQYCNWDVSEDEKTLGGVSIPKGRKLLDIFPDGMCAVGINGFKTIIGLYPENHKDHIVTGIYHLQSFSGVGKGISDAVDVKKEMDDLHSQTMAYVKAHSTPATYYNQDMISEEQARNIGKPRKVIPVDFTNAPDGVNSINQAIQALAPQNPASSIFEYKDVLNSWLQMSMQVTEFSNGLPGVDNKTATGAKIGDENAALVLVPQHRNKADHRKRSDKVVYNLFKRFVNKEKFFQTRSKNGITAGKYLSGTQFDGVDIDFEIVANSEIPKTPYQQVQNLSQLLQFTGGLGGLIQATQMNPDLTSDVVHAFGVDNLSIPNQKDIARVCRRRINQAKQILEMELKNQQLMSAVGMPADNTNLAAAVVSQLTPPISPKEKYPNEKAAWMADLLDSDELSYAPQELRYVIEEMIDRQLEASAVGQAQVQQDASMGYVMGNLPMILGEQAMNQQNMALENQYQQQQQQQQAQMQMAQQQQQGQMQMQQGQMQLQQLQAQNDQQRLQTQQAHLQNQGDVAAEAQKGVIQNQLDSADHQRQLQLHDQEFQQAMQLEKTSHDNKLAQLAAQAKLRSAQKNAQSSKSN